MNEGAQREFNAFIEGVRLAKENARISRRVYRNEAWAKEAFERARSYLRFARHRKEMAS